MVACERAQRGVSFAVRVGWNAVARRFPLGNSFLRRCLGLANQMHLRCDQAGPTQLACRRVCASQRVHPRRMPPHECVPTGTLVGSARSRGRHLERHCGAVELFKAFRPKEGQSPEAKASKSGEVRAVLCSALRRSRSETAASVSPRPSGMEPKRTSNTSRRACRRERTSPA